MPFVKVTTTRKIGNWYEAYIGHVFEVTLDTAIINGTGFYEITKETFNMKRYIRHDDCEELEGKEAELELLARQIKNTLIK